MSKPDEDTVCFQNPFKAQARKNHEDTLKHCAWEVLKDFPQGLHVSQIAKEIQARGLRDLSRMRNATGQVSSELVRAKGVFCQTRDKKVWKIRALSSPGRDVPTAAPPISTPELPKGQALVGHRVAVWWKGEDAYFEGVIRRFDITADSYDVVYDDGDTDDDLKFHKYDVHYKEGKIEVITVAEHNRDDSEDSGSEDEESKEDVSEWEASEASFDSTVCGDDGDSVSKARRKTAERKKAAARQAAPSNARPPPRTTFLDASNRTIIPILSRINQHPMWMNGMAVDEACVDRKRRTHPREDEKTLKKTKLEEGINSPRIGQSTSIPGLRSSLTIAKGANLGWPNKPQPLTLNHILAHNWRTHQAQPAITITSAPVCRPVFPPQREDRMPSQQLTDNTSSSQMPVAGPSCLPQSAQPTCNSFSPLKIPTPKVEKIDVLDLKRQMQPPENKRPDLKNLTDIGELMSLTELSDELKHLQSEEEEVTSKCAAGVESDHQEKDSQMPDGLQKDVRSTTSTITDAVMDLAAETHGKLAIKKSEPVMSHPAIPLWKTRQPSATLAQIQNPALQFVSSDQNPLQPQSCISRKAGLSLGGCDLLSPSILSKQLIGDKHMTPNRLLTSDPCRDKFGAPVGFGQVKIEPSVDQEQVRMTSPVQRGTVPPDPRVDSAMTTFDRQSVKEEPTSQPLSFDPALKAQTATAGERPNPARVSDHWKDGVSIAHA